MTRNIHPPKNIHPLHWNNIKAKRNRTAKQEIRAYYRIDPILWAVIKRYDTPQLLQQRFPTWAPQRLDKAIHQSIDNNHIKPWGDHYIPTEEREQLLRRRQPLPRLDAVPPLLALPSDAGAAPAPRQHKQSRPFSDNTNKG